MGLIYDVGRAYIRDYPEQDVEIAPQVTVRAGSLKAEDVNLLVRKLDKTAPSKLNPLVAEIVSDAIEDIILLVRLVAQAVRVGFRGMAATGRQLDINWIRAKDIVPYSISGKITWLVSDTEIPSAQGGSGTGTKTYKPETTVGDEEGLIFMGFVDPIERPKVDAVRFSKAGVPMVPQTLNWNIRPGFGPENLPVAALERPVYVGPKQTYKIENFWFATGDDRLEPIGFIVKRAEAFAL